MEQRPDSPEGGEHHHDTHEEQPEPIYEQLSDEQRIQRGIADALNEERPIDDGTAALIAGRLREQLAASDDSALHALAASGALAERLERDLLESVQDLPVAHDSWIDALLDYADGRGEDRGPRKNWRQVSQDESELPITNEAEGPAGSREQDASGEHPDTAEGTPSPERAACPHPRIYVRCLAAYNNGILHGCWIDAAQDEESLLGDVEAMLNDSPIPGAEEYAIHDYENFSGYRLGEYEALAFVSRLAQGIAEHGQAFAAYAEWIGQEDRELEHFSEHFEGAYLTREAWAEEVADEIFEWPRWLNTIPEILRPHVRLDLADLALTLEQYRHIAEGDGEIYVFNPDA